LLFLAWPGWLHPRSAKPGAERRVAWALDADPSLEGLARQLQRWRAEGLIPPEANGFNYHPETAHYCAWFAPDERSFYDGRSAVAAIRVSEYLGIRLDMTGFDPGDTRPWQDVFRRFGITHLLMTSADADETASIARRLMADPGQWDVWRINGRTIVLGWRDPLSGGSTAGRTGPRFDPVREAFHAGPAAPLPPPPALDHRAPKHGFWDRYFTPGLPIPDGNVEAVLLMRYGEQAVDSAERAKAAPSVAVAFGAGTGWGLLTSPVLSVAFDHAEEQARAGLVDRTTAIPILAIRAARRAAAENPDDPEAYLRLAQAYMSHTTVKDFEKSQLMSAWHSGLARVPTDLSHESPARLELFGTAAVQLARRHREADRLDLALECTRLTLRLSLAVKSRGLGTTDVQLMEWKDAVRRLEEEVAVNREGYSCAAGLMAPGADTPLDNERLALDHGLVREALAVLSPAALVPDRTGFRAAARCVRLELESVGDADYADLWFRDTIDRGITVPDAELRQEFGQLSVLVPLARGDYARARQALAEGVIRRSDQRPPNPAEVPALMPGQVWNIPAIPEPALACLALVATHPWMSLGQACFEVGVEARSHTFRALRDEAARELRMGLIALEEGDTEAARAHFKAAVRPQGVPVAFQDRALAIKYLQMMGG
jgi:hypothetical protein